MRPPVPLMTAEIVPVPVPLSVRVLTPMLMGVVPVWENNIWPLLVMLALAENVSDSREPLKVWSDDELLVIPLAPTVRPNWVPALRLKV